MELTGLDYYDGIHSRNNLRIEREFMVSNTKGRELFPPTLFRAERENGTGQDGNVVFRKS